VDKVYSRAASAAKEGQKATLAVVTDAAGHTPQVVGARMLVYADGRIEGTVGGGRFEYEVIHRAKTLTDAKESQLTTLHLGAELGMCCGGRMEVLTTPLHAQLSWLEEVNAHQQQGQPVWIKTELSGTRMGTRMISSTAVPTPQGRAYEGTGVTTDTDGQRYLVESLAPAPRLILFGAGHVARPTAQLASTLGYRVVVVDDRPDWNTNHRFPSATEQILESYEDFMHHFRPQENDSLLIITQGHDFDQMILEKVISYPVAYLGMIGSETKVIKAVKKLRARDVAANWIEKLHAPIGIDIGALTPDEIAVSIMAEIITVRRKGTTRN